MGKLWFLGLFFIPLLIVSCSPTGNSIYTSIVQSQTMYPTNTPVPIDTFESTPTQTATVLPTDTPTPSPTLIATFTPSPSPTPDILKILQEAGIEFPESSTSHLEREYGEFNYRVSKDLMERIGKVTTHLPEDVLERMYLHAMGRYMLFTRNSDPQRYKGFIDLAGDIRDRGYQDDDSSLYTDWPIF